MIELELEVIYQLNLTDKIMFGPIKKQFLYERFTDGRVFGLMGEELAKALYNNISGAPTEKASYDLLDDEGRKYECRTLNQNGVSLLPSSQLGKGRKYNEKEHLAKLHSIYAFVFADVRDSPIFKIVALPTDKVGEKRRLTANQFDKLVSGLEIRPI